MSSFTRHFRQETDEKKNRKESTCSIIYRILPFEGCKTVGGSGGDDDGDDEASLFFLLSHDIVISSALTS